MTEQTRLFTSGAATISPCGSYRYSLTRELGGTGGTCNFIMLNPSTADAEEDDPTIRRCVGFCRAWGYRELVVTNLFAFRATDPAALAVAADPVGPDNDDALLEHASRSDALLRLTKDGHPSHFLCKNMGGTHEWCKFAVLDPCLAPVRDDHLESCQEIEGRKSSCQSKCPGICWN